MDATLHEPSAATPTDEFDSPTEVEATFRTQRRAALSHVVVFLMIVFGVPTLNIVLDWWTRARLLGGMSPSFVMAAVGLYVFFFVLAVAAASLANGIEDGMLGAHAGDDEDVPAERPGP